MEIGGGREVKALVRGGGDAQRLEVLLLLRRLGLVDACLPGEIVGDR